MKALTLWQPWASLTMLHRAESVEHSLPWKQIETRSWPAPASVIGQRIAIHAADLQIFAGPFPDIRTRPSVDPVGAQPRLPLGAIIGTAVLARCVPMVHATQPRDLTTGSLVIGPPPHNTMTLHGTALATALGDGPVDVTDQAPFGIYAPGRWAWLLDDPQPLTEPITLRGFQGLWNVPAHIEERLRG